jgi:hypothetical protein
LKKLSERKPSAYPEHAITGPQKGRRLKGGFFIFCTVEEKKLFSNFLNIKISLLKYCFRY